MGDDWRVCIAFGDLPGQLESCRRALIPALGGRFGDQVAVTEAPDALLALRVLVPASGSGLEDQVAVTSSDTQIFLYARNAESADEAAQVARDVLARHDVSAPVRTERWSPWEQEWRDASDEPSADVAAERQAVHEYRQEKEREWSVTTGIPFWQVRVELRSHHDVVALAGHLAAQGWRVRPRRRYLIAWADCEDDAKGLARALSSDGGPERDTALSVRRVSYSYIPPGSLPG